MAVAGSSLVHQSRIACAFVRSGLHEAFEQPAVEPLSNGSSNTAKSLGEKEFVRGVRMFERKSG